MRAAVRCPSGARHAVATSLRRGSARSAAPALWLILALSATCPPLRAMPASEGETGATPVPSGCRLGGPPTDLAASPVDAGSCAAVPDSQDGAARLPHALQDPAALALRLVRRIRLAMPPPAVDAAAGLPVGVAPWRLAATTGRDRGAGPAGAAAREFARRLLARFGLDTQHGDRLWLPAARWSLGVETDGPVRWVADVYADERSRTWLSTGISWPLVDTVTANLAWSQPLKAARHQRWTLGLGLAF